MLMVGFGFFFSFKLGLLSKKLKFRLVKRNMIKKKFKFQIMKAFIIYIVLKNNNKTSSYYIFFACDVKLFCVVHE